MVLPSLHYIGRRDMSCAKLHYKMRMLHCQDIMVASKHHYVMDFNGDTPHLIYL